MWALFIHRIRHSSSNSPNQSSWVPFQVECYGIHQKYSSQILSGLENPNSPQCKWLNLVRRYISRAKLIMAQKKECNQSAKGGHMSMLRWSWKKKNANLVCDQAPTESSWFWVVNATLVSKLIWVLSVYLWSFKIVFTGSVYLLWTFNTQL